MGKWSGEGDMGRGEDIGEILSTELCSKLTKLMTVKLLTVFRQGRTR